MAIAKEIGRPVWIAGAHNNLGICEYRRGNNDAAMSFYDRAKKELVMETVRDSMLLGSINDNVATILMEEGKTEDSAEEENKQTSESFIPYEKKEETGIE